MNKRRRILEESASSPSKQSSIPVRTSNVPPNFMTPTKASLAKSYPHLAKSQLPRGPQHRISSPTRQRPRRSVPPEGLTETVEIGRPFLDIANEDDDDGMRTLGSPEIATRAGAKSVAVETHLSVEEEIERQKGVLMRRLRVLRGECEILEQKLDQARQSREHLLDAQRKAQSNIEGTMYPP